MIYPVRNHFANLVFSSFVPLWYTRLYILQMLSSGHNIYQPSELETKFRAYLFGLETSTYRVWLGYTESAVCSHPVILCLVVEKDHIGHVVAPSDPAAGTLRTSQPMDLPICTKFLVSAERRHWRIAAKP
jgi:hypothetical protein